MHYLVKHVNACMLSSFAVDLRSQLCTPPFLFVCLAPLFLQSQLHCSFVSVNVTIICLRRCKVVGDVCLKIYSLSLLHIHMRLFLCPSLTPVPSLLAFFFSASSFWNTGLFCDGWSLNSLGWGQAVTDACSTACWWDYNSQSWTGVN